MIRSGDIVLRYLLTGFVGQRDSRGEPLYEGDRLHCECRESCETESVVGAPFGHRNWSEDDYSYDGSMWVKVH